MKRTALTLLAATLALAACGGGGTTDTERSTATTEGRSASERTTTTEEATEGRPEGDWVLNRFGVDSGPDGDVLRAVRRSWRFEPTCESGPCDLLVTPSGPESTFLGPGYPVLPSDEIGEPFTVAYRNGVYSFVEPEATDYCTKADGSYSAIPGSAAFEGRFEFEFVEANGDGPDQLVGTKTEKWTPSAAGTADGCTADTTTMTWTLSARPIDAAFPEAAVDGEFGVTFVASEADQQSIALDDQLIGWERSLAQPWSLTTSCQDKICALGASFTTTKSGDRSFGLLPRGDGWAGGAEPWTEDCVANGTSTVVAAGAYTDNLTISDLRIVDATDGRATVLVGHYRHTGIPDANVAASDPVNCFASYRDGQIFLVSTEAVNLLR